MHELSSTYVTVDMDDHAVVVAGVGVDVEVVLSVLRWDSLCCSCEVPGSLPPLRLSPHRSETEYHLQRSKCSRSVTWLSLDGTLVNTIGKYDPLISCSLMKKASDCSWSTAAIINDQFIVDNEYYNIQYDILALAQCWIIALLFSIIMNPAEVRTPTNNNNNIKMGWKMTHRHSNKTQQQPNKK